MIMSRNVDHDSTGGGDLLFFVRSDDSGGGDTLNKIPLVLKNDGNVGIGTDSPSTSLMVQNGTSTPEISLFHDSGTNQGKGRLVFYTDGAGAKEETAYIELRQETGTSRKGEIAFAVSDNGAPSEGAWFDNNCNLNFANGKGVGFAASGTDGTTMSSELLDDYEEGTWTPAYGGSTTNPSGGSTQANYGYYTKIGKMVHVMWYLYWSAFTNVGAGSLIITGLPFDKSSSANEEGFGVNVSHYNPFIPHGQFPRVYGADSFGFLGITSVNTSWDWATTSLLSTTNVNLTHGSLTYFTD